MTREEAIRELSVLWERHRHYKGQEAIRYFMDGNYTDALEMAIEVLEAEPCEDAISRQAVLSMQYRIDDSATLSTRDVVNVDDIEELPSVNPQPKTDKKKKFDFDEEQEQIDFIRPKKSIPVMLTVDGDCISRQDAIKAACEGADAWDGGCSPSRNEYIENAIKDIVPVTPQPKTGHWIQTEEKDDAEPCILWECSCCHKEFRGVVHKVSNYCPNCGAKMIES